ncbi:MAG TPA: RIP metalloprotease RseP [Rhizomicrobium sp.]|jgi:regulator of sigma E protease
MLGAIHYLLDWIPIGLPAFVVVITTIVFFHELGHFAMARACGVRVETFSIGFGPAIVRWQDRKGTQWKISWIPLGGFVKFFGDADAASTPDRELAEGMSAADRAVAFPFKPLYQRALIVAAGPVANFILAIVVFAGLFAFVGAPEAGTTIGEVAPHSAAAQAGLRLGDKIVAVNGNSVSKFEDLRTLIGHSHGSPLALKVDRHGKEFLTRATPHKFQTTDIFGDRVSANGLGVGPTYDDSNYIYVKMSPAEALEAGVEQTWARVALTLTYVERIVTGQSGGGQLHGIFGIAKVTQHQAASGPSDLVFLIAVLSVSIGLVNLFPIPVLDGGHLLYYGCEAVLGRPLGARAQDIGFRLGLAMILGLFLFATWNDLVRPILF